MKKSAKLLGAAAIAVGAMFVGGTAQAETEVSANLGVATDYIFRGVDQTGFYDEGEVFGGVDATSGSFYAGAWVSNTGPNPAQFIEYDLYAGWKPTLGPVALDLGVIYYGYTDSDAGGGESDLSTFELKAAGSISTGGATWGAAVYWTPNFSGDFDGLDDNDGFYYELNGAYTFSNNATLSGAIGVVDVDDYAVDGYTTWNLGVTYPILENLSIDARYIDTDNDAFFYGAAGDRLIGTLKVTF
ncbi:MAG: TorF family putative porin [Hyphomonadaceae bacterium]|nr:TorF family putative porin [Hyphomonadaceae bacterium]MCA8886252.1 TorF family putative porin [Hyphomonadaceae bacterium]